MNKIFIYAVAAAVFFTPILPTVYAATSPKASTAAKTVYYPRIDKAIVSLQDVVALLQAAPSIFGGHKADAIAACDKAIQELKLALAYRDSVDKK